MCLNRLDAGQCHRECTTRILAGHVWLARLLYRSDELNELCGIGIAHQFDTTARRLLVQSSRIAQHHGRARAIASSYHAGRAEHFRPHVVTVRSGKARLRDRAGSIVERDHHNRRVEQPGTLEVRGYQCIGSRIYLDRVIAWIEPQQRVEVVAQRLQKDRPGRHRVTPTIMPGRLS